MTEPHDPRSAPDLDILLAHADWVRALARSLVRDEHAAEDVAQDAWVAALERPPRGGSAWRAYLGTIVRNLVRDRRKVASNRERRERAAARNEAQGPSDRFETFQEIVRAVDALDEPYRSAVLLRWFEGLPPRAVAERLGVPVRTVDSRLERALAKLRERLDREHGGRAAWMAIMLPLAEVEDSPAAPLAAHAKLVTAALVVLAAGAWWWWSGSERASPTEGSSTALASELDREPVRGPAASAPASDGSHGAREPLAALVVERDPPWDVPHFAIRVLTQDDEPIAGARVSVWHSPLETADALYFEFPDARSLEQEKRSDAEGWTVFAAQPGRRFTAEVAVEGRVPRRSMGLAAGGEHVVRFGPPKIVRGRVVRAKDGAPVEGARVACVLGGGGTPHLESEIVAETVTASDGGYAIAGVSSDTVELFVRSSDRATAFATVQIAGVDAPAHDFALRERASLRGVVRDARTKRPIAGAAVDRHSGSRIWPPATTDAEGRFELPGFGDEGSAPLLRVRAAHYGEEVARHVDGVESLDVELEPERVVRGRVVDERGAPLPGAYVMAAGWHRGGLFEAIENRGTRTDAQGRFELCGLRRTNAHRIRVHVEEWGGVTVELADDTWPLDVVDAGDLVLRRAGSIAGVVRGGDGEPVWGAKLGATRVGEGAPLRKDASDASGRFTLFELDPGEYDVTVEVAGRATIDPQRVVVLADRTSEIAIELPSGLAIRGRVLGPTRDAVGGAEVVARTKQGATIASCRSKADGAFELFDLPAGAYELEAKLGRNVQTPGGIVRVGHAHAKDVGAGSDNVDLALPPFVRLHGRVLDASGAPVADASLRLVDEDGNTMIVSTDADGRFENQAPLGSSQHVAVDRMEPDPEHPGAQRDVGVLVELDWIVSEQELVVRLP